MNDEKLIRFDNLNLFDFDFDFDNLRNYSLFPADHRYP